MRTRSLAGSLFAATVAVLGLSAVFAVSAGAQVNGARLAIGPTMPTSTTVGAKGVPVFISLTNLSEPTDGRLIIPADSITFTPPCASLPVGRGPPSPLPTPGSSWWGRPGRGRPGRTLGANPNPIPWPSPPPGQLSST